MLKIDFHTHTADDPHDRIPYTTEQLIDRAAVLGYGGRFTWTALRGDPQFVPLLEEALAAVGETPTSLRVMLMGRLAAGPLRDDPDATRRRSLSQRALDDARAIGDQTTLAFALEARFGSIMSPDFTGEMMELTGEIHTAAVLAGDDEKVLMARLWRIMVGLYEGKMRDVSSERHEVARLAEQLRQGPQNWFIRCTDASLALLAGRLDEAKRLSITAYESGRRAEPYALFAHRVQMLWIYLLEGITDEAQAVFRDSVSRFSVYPVWRAILPSLLLSYGMEEDARSSMDAVLASARPVNEEWTLGEGVLADAVASFGDKRSAASLYDELLPYAHLTMGGIPDINLARIQIGDNTIRHDIAL